MISTTLFPWDALDEKTQQRYLRAVRVVSQIATSVIATKDKKKAWQSFCDFMHYGNLDMKFPSAVQNVLHCLADAYNNADHWTVRRMILSMLADQLTIGIIHQYLPNIFHYAYYQARLHAKEYGVGAVLKPDPQIRIRYDPQQVQHFAWYLASPFVATELPFGEAVMKLSTGEQLTVANVIRDRISSRVVEQYLAYCKDTCSKDFQPLARSTLLKLLSELPASTRTSIAGVDYVVAGGVEAFNSLIRTIDRLVEHGLEITEGNEIKQKLKSSKQYLLSDFKAHVENATPISTHCISHSLSDPSDPHFAVACNHNHDFACDRCCMICETLESINAAIVEQKNLDADAKNDLIYTVHIKQQNLPFMNYGLIRSNKLLRIKVVQIVLKSCFRNYQFI